MSEPFVGEIRVFGFSYAPRGWAFCDGQLLPIAQHQALYALLGTAYGGNGRTTFALPDLRTRVAVHRGPGIKLGQRGGSGAKAPAGPLRPAGLGPRVVLSKATSGARPFLALNFCIALNGLFPPRS